MANAYSIQRNRQGWIAPTDQEFTAKALMAKDQKYDSNRAKVDSVIEQYKSLQLARDVDKKYLGERLNYIIDNVNNSQNQDFSSNGFTSVIQNYIGNALDDNVMTAVQETAKIRKYQEDVAKIREKNPELYNPLNEGYGLAPAQEYLQNEEVGAKIKGSLTYTPYKDVEGEVNKWLTDIQMKAKDGVIEIPDNHGRIQKITVTGKTAQELKDLALGFIGNRYDDQLKVNVWGSTGGFKNLSPMVEGAVKQYDTHISQQNRILNSLKAKLTGPVSEEEKASLENSIKSIENNILQNSQMKETLKSNPLGALTHLEKEKIANRSGMALGLLRSESVEYKAYDYYFKQLDNARENKKMEFETIKHADQMAVEAQKLRLEQAKIQLKLSGDGTSSSTSASGSTGAGGFVIEDADKSTLDGVQESYTDMWKKDISDKYQDMTKFNNQVMNTVVGIANGTVQSSPDKVKAAKILIEEFKSKGGDINTKSPKQAQEFLKMMSRADAYSSLTMIPVGNRSVNVKQIFQDKWNEYSMTAKAFNSARANAQKEEAAAGSGKAYGENLQFVDTAKKYVPYTLSKAVRTTVTSKNKADYMSIISAADEIKGTGAVPVIAEDTPFRVKDLRNGKYEVTFMTKEKDSDNLVERKATVDNKVVNQVIPGLGEFYQRPVPKYTLQTMGTKPLVSPTIKFASPDSSDFHNVVESVAPFATSPVDTNLVDQYSAKNTILQTVGASGIRDQKVAQQLNAMVDILLDEGTMSKFRTGVGYDYSAASEDGRGFLNLYAKNGRKVAAVNMGIQPNLDNFVKMNQWAPQVSYSKVVMSELTKVMQSYRQTGRLELTPGLKTILNG